MSKCLRSTWFYLVRVGWGDRNIKIQSQKILRSQAGELCVEKKVTFGGNHFDPITSFRQDFFRQEILWQPPSMTLNTFKFPCLSLCFSLSPECLSSLHSHFSSLSSVKPFPFFFFFFNMPVTFITLIFFFFYFWRV